MCIRDSPDDDQPPVTGERDDEQPRHRGHTETAESRRPDGTGCGHTGSDEPKRADADGVRAPNTVGVVVGVVDTHL